jgi:hypothetical protein
MNNEKLVAVAVAVAVGRKQSLALYIISEVASRDHSPPASLIFLIHRFFS